MRKKVERRIVIFILSYIQLLLHPSKFLSPLRSHSSRLFTLRTRQRARSRLFPILTVKINGRRRRKLHPPWPFLSREPESPAETGLAGLSVLEKCPARVHVCVGTYARVARAAFAVYRRHARYLSWREEQFYGEKIFFLVNASTYAHKVTDPLFVS